ncbi:MAG: hypothetical protein F6K11_26615 [Leptolyngbya sp. SIO3F4]|nr:hypothetical protein [Leptolyngbya sp. SIO3F4]
MQKQSSHLVQWSSQPGPISWKTVPDFIQKVLTAEGCTLLKHYCQRPQLAHIRFQYLPLSYQGNLYYLQKWSCYEWGVSPSQLIFPAEGSCPFDVLSNGSLLSLVVKKAVSKFYGDSPDNSPLQPSPSTKRYTKNDVFPIAG